MPRRLLAVAALTLSAIAVVLGCQDYNFNPVGACIIQPGSRQVKLAAVTTADVLFVVDDSMSMDTKQQALAGSFSTFIDALAAAQKDRVARGLEAFEFHLAVTTSSVFRDYGMGPNTGFSTQFESQFTPGCTHGVGVAGGQYPQGGFVAAGANAKVLHFTKDLNWSSWGTASPDPAISALVRQFVGTNSGGTWSGGNVEVGSCGSNEEQHMQAARLALQKAMAGQQPGVDASEFGHLGAKLVLVFVGDEDDCSSDPANPLVLAQTEPGNDSCVADRFKASDQQLYAVGDFATYFSSLVIPAGQTPTAARPYDSMGAAFIVSAVRCADGSYAPMDGCEPTGGVRVDPSVCPVLPPASCIPPEPVCGVTTCSPANPSACNCDPSCGVAYGAGVRFFGLADELRKAGVDDIVEGSVALLKDPVTKACEDFGSNLAAIADLVKAPSALRLPSQPASDEVVVVRILASGGGERKVCAQATGDAQRSTSGWWFMDCADRMDPPAVSPGPTTCIYLNQSATDPTNNCLANPGETYSAEYLGQVPQGGCPNPSTDATAAHSSAECAAALGGNAENWWCYGQGAVGTCLCNRSAP